MTDNTPQYDALTRDAAHAQKSWVFHCTAPGTYRVTLFVDQRGEIGLRFTDFTESCHGRAEVRD